MIVGGSGPASVRTAAAGIRYAVSHGAQVINLPFGIGGTSPATCDPVLQAAVAYALGHDVVLVASSGNASRYAGPGEPASCAGVLAVGGIEPDGSLWRGSTRQPYVAVAAPADHMVYVGRDGRYTTTGEGTSFSAALTAGTAALIRSRYPDMPWYRVDQRLTGTATPAGHPVPNQGYGYGIINPARAVNASAYPVPASAPNPVYREVHEVAGHPGGPGGGRAVRAGRPGTGHPRRPGRPGRLRAHAVDHHARDRDHRGGGGLRLRDGAGVRAQDVLTPSAARRDGRPTPSPQAPALGRKILVVRPR